MSIADIDFPDTAIDRRVDAAVAVAIAFGLGVIFFLDGFVFRGAVGGVAYAALVALCARYGLRAVVLMAALSTALTVIGALQASDTGTALAELWLARALAIAAIWIVAGTLAKILRSNDASRQTLETLDLVSEAIYIEDANGFVRYANRTAQDLASANGGDTDYPKPDVALSASSDMREIHRDGREFEMQRVRLPDGGILARLNDVTLRNAALSARRQMEVRLQQSEKMEAIGRLAGGVAHDFNNILGAILGFAAFLVQDLPDRPEERAFAERILSACKRGKELVEQILAFAHARTVEHGVVDVGLLLKRNREFLANFMPAQIALDVVRPEVALPVFGSAVQLNQLIVNLCLNARDAIGDTPGTIDVTAGPAQDSDIEKLALGISAPGEKIFGKIDPARRYCVLQVADTGKGIAPAIFDRIFEPFFTTKGRHRGTGLGLAVVHGVVEATGGFCHLRSTVGVGTVFSVFFPLASRVAQTKASELDRLNGRERILIVDDERDIADMLAIGLERLDYETVAVGDPFDALAAFREEPEAFDLVVTDQVMPGMRGLDLIRQLKSIRPDVKAVLCTGFSDSANEDVSREAGADAFFYKPVDATQIAFRARRLFGRAETTRAVG